MATINIPTILRPLTQQQKCIKLDAKNVAELIDNMDKQYPGIKERIMKGEQVHRFMNIYINDEDIRFSDNIYTQLNENDVITILPAVAGGTI